MQKSAAAFYPPAYADENLLCVDWMSHSGPRSLTNTKCTRSHLLVLPLHDLRMELRQDLTSLISFFESG
jgi:hypothetical protein